TLPVATAFRSEVTSDDGQAFSKAARRVGRRRDMGRAPEGASIGCFDLSNRTTRLAPCIDSVDAGADGTRSAARSARGRATLRRTITAGKRVLYNGRLEGCLRRLLRAGNAVSHARAFPFPRRRHVDGA